MSDVNISDVSISDIVAGLEIEPEDTEDFGDVLGDVVGDVQIGSLWGSFKKLGKSIGSAAKSIARSPIVKTVAGGAAIVFPPVGIPATAALVAADRAIAIAEGKKGTPKQQAAMKQAIGNTVKLAQKGDPDAKRAVEFMTLAGQIRAKTGGHPIGPPKLSAAQAKEAIEGPLVQPNGQIVRGKWLKVG